MAEGDEEHAPPPSPQVALASLGLPVLSLVAVVGLAKQLAPTIEAGVTAVAAPRTTVGLVIALIVLAPESMAALPAPARNRLRRLADSIESKAPFWDRE